MDQVQETCQGPVTSSMTLSWKPTQGSRSERTENKHTYNSPSKNYEPRTVLI